MTSFTVRQLRKEDFPGLMDTEPKFEDLLIVINQQAKTLESILNKGIGPDNLNAQVVEFDVGISQAYPMKIGLKVKGKPIGILALRAVDTTLTPTGDPTGLAWSVDWATEGSLLHITGLPGLSAASKYHVTIAIVGG